MGFMSTELTPSKQIEALKEANSLAVALAVTKMMPEVVVDLQTDGSVSEKLKFIDQAYKLLGWNEPPAKDPTSHLPMTNIVINLPPIPNAEVPEVITIQSDPALIQYADVNADLEGLDD